jgi:hypothetical protein
MLKIKTLLLLLLAAGAAVAKQSEAGTTGGSFMSKQIFSMAQESETVKKAQEEVYTAAQEEFGGFLSAIGDLFFGCFKMLIGGHSPAEIQEAWKEGLVEQTTEAFANVQDAAVETAQGISGDLYDEVVEKGMNTAWDAVTSGAANIPASDVLKATQSGEWNEIIKKALEHVDVTEALSDYVPSGTYDTGGGAADDGKSGNTEASGGTTQSQTTQFATTQDDLLDAAGGGG